VDVGPAGSRVAVDLEPAGVRCLDEALGERGSSLAECADLVRADGFDAAVRDAEHTFRGEERTESQVVVHHGRVGELDAQVVDRCAVGKSGEIWFCHVCTTAWHGDSSGRGRKHEGKLRRRRREPLLEEGRSVRVVVVAADGPVPGPTVHREGLLQRVVRVEANDVVPEAAALSAVLVPRMRLNSRQ